MRCNLKPDKFLTQDLDGGNTADGNCSTSQLLCPSSRYPHAMRIWPSRSRVRGNTARVSVSVRTQSLFSVDSRALRLIFFFCQKGCVSPALEQDRTALPWRDSLLPSHFLILSFCTLEPTISPLCGSMPSSFAGSGQHLGLQIHCGSGCL